MIFSNRGVSPETFHNQNVCVSIHAQRFFTESHYSAVRLSNLGKTEIDITQTIIIVFETVVCTSCVTRNSTIFKRKSRTWVSSFRFLVFWCFLQHNTILQVGLCDWYYFFVIFKVFRRKPHIDIIYTDRSKSVPRHVYGKIYEREATWKCISSTTTIA